MKLDISKALTSLGQEFPFEVTINVPSQNMYGETIVVDPVKIKGVFLSTGDDIVVYGNMDTTVSGKCARCLKPVHETIELDFEETYVRENPDEDLDLFMFEGYQIELDKLVISLLIPEIPLKFSCKTDCSNGLFINDEEEYETLKKEAQNDNPFGALRQMFNNDEEV